MAALNQPSITSSTSKQRQLPRRRRDKLLQKAGCALSVSLQLKEGYGCE
jgi:hypothetical protein